MILAKREIVLRSGKEAVSGAARDHDIRGEAGLCTLRLHCRRFRPQGKIPAPMLH